MKEAILVQSLHGIDRNEEKTERNKRYKLLYSGAEQSPHATSGVEILIDQKWKTKIRITETSK